MAIMHIAILLLFACVFLFFATINYQGGDKFIRFQALLFISMMVLIGVIIGLILGS